MLEYWDSGLGLLVSGLRDAGRNPCFSPVGEPAGLDREELDNRILQAATKETLRFGACGGFGFNVSWGQQLRKLLARPTILEPSALPSLNIFESATPPIPKVGAIKGIRESESS